MQRIVFHALAGCFQRRILVLRPLLGGPKAVLQDDIFRNVPVDTEHGEGAVATAVNGADGPHVAHLAVVGAAHAELTRIGGLSVNRVLHPALDFRSVVLRYHAAPLFHRDRNVSRHAVKLIDALVPMHGAGGHVQFPDPDP